MALYKRPDSKFWWMKFQFDGETVQQSTKCSNKRDAGTVESAYRTRLALGKIGIEPKKEAPTFDNAVEDFLKWSKVEHAAKPTTYNRYYYSCQLLKQFFSKAKVNRIESKDVEKFVVWRSSQKSRKTKDFITYDTLNNELLVLKMIFSRLLEAKILRDSPARSVKRLSENERQFYVLTDDEEKLYIMACPQPLQDVAIIMLETGMRCGEVYRIRRSEVFLNKGYLKVTKGKTKAAIRQVHLTKKAQSVLSYRLNKFKGENLFPRKDIDGELPTSTLDKLHICAIEKLCFKFRLYDCRHTFATRAVENGVDLVTLASILGHASLRMVIRYAHPSETHKADAIKQMEMARINKKAKAV